MEKRIKLTAKQIEMLNQLDSQKRIATVRLDDLVRFLISSEEIEGDIIETKIIDNEFVIITK